MCQTTSFEVDRIFGQIWSCPTWLVPSAWTRCTAGTCDWRLCESFIDSMATKVARVCWRGWPELHATMHNFLKRRYGRWWVRWQTDGYSGNWQSKWKGSLLYHEIVGVLCEYSRWLQLQRCLRANDRRVCTMDMGWAGDKDKVPCHMIFSWVSCLLVFEKFWTKSSGSQGVCSKGPVQNFLDGLIVPSMFVIQFFLLLAISLVLMPHASLGRWWKIAWVMNSGLQPLLTRYTQNIHPSYMRCYPHSMTLWNSSWPLSSSRVQKKNWMAFAWPKWKTSDLATSVDQWDWPAGNWQAWHVKSRLMIPPKSLCRRLRHASRRNKKHPRKSRGGKENMLSTSATNVNLEMNSVWFRNEILYLVMFCVYIYFFLLVLCHLFIHFTLVCFFVAIILSIILQSLYCRYDGIWQTNTRSRGVLTVLSASNFRVTHLVVLLIGFGTTTSSTGKTFQMEMLRDGRKFPILGSVKLLMDPRLLYGWKGPKKQNTICLSVSRTSWRQCSWVCRKVTTLAWVAASRSSMQTSKRPSSGCNQGQVQIFAVRGDCAIF